MRGREKISPVWGLTLISEFKRDVELHDTMRKEKIFPIISMQPGLTKMRRNLEGGWEHHIQYHRISGRGKNSATCCKLEKGEENIAAYIWLGVIY